jgi:hypothetical protein
MKFRAIPIILLALQGSAATGAPKPSAAGAQTFTPPLCPPLPPVPAGADDLRFSEADFTEQKFESSWAYFEHQLSRDLQRVEKTADLTDREGFWIMYGNSLRLMRGYMLKQAAQLERASRPGITTLASDSGTATFRFCRFLATVPAVD